MPRLIILVILYLVIAYFASWWPFKEERWEGYVYPNGGDLTVHQYVGKYETLEDCRSAAVDRLYSLNARDRGDYECGLNCESQGIINICEETSR